MMVLSSSIEIVDRVFAGDVAAMQMWRAVRGFSVVPDCVKRMDGGISGVAFAEGARATSACVRMRCWWGEFLI